MTMAWKYSDMQHDHFLDSKGDKDIFKCRRIGFVHKIQVLPVDQIICGEHIGVIIYLTNGVRT